MPDSKKPFEIPLGYYIDINGSPGMTYGHYKADNGFIDEGCCFITLYKSLDHGHGRPPVEHVVKVNTFKLVDLDKKSFAEGLEEIRDGIEKLIDGCSDCMGRFWNRKPRV